jgi:stalled ribosome rescue protein Dom34
MTVLLIDHQRARFFEAVSTAGGLEERGSLEPKDPHGFLRHLEHRKEADYQGQRVPEGDEFYDRVAQRLKESSSIVVVGDATGKSSAARYLLDYLKEKHKEIADRIAGVEHADLSAITLGEIEGLARRYRS